MALVGDTRVDHATGAARRRRERCLRAYLKYARMTVAMALAEANHHTAPRGQKTARAEATNDTSKERVAGDVVYFELFDEDTAGLRPGPVLDPRPQEQVLQHTVEHEDANCPFVRILDDLVPQLGEQLVHFFRSLDTQLPVEQVIDEPKISDDSIQPGMGSLTIQFAAEVFLVFSQCGVQRRLGELNILFLVEVFMVQRLELNTFIIKIFPQGRDQQWFAEMEDLLVVLKTLSQDKVQQRLVEQMMLKTSSGAPKSYLEYTRREYSSPSEEEEVEEEEETEQMDLEEQPSRFQGHFRPRRYCASILRGGLCWRGSSCTFTHSYDELHPDVQRQR